MVTYGFPRGYDLQQNKICFRLLPRKLQRFRNAGAILRTCGRYHTVTECHNFELIMTVIFKDTHKHAVEPGL